MTLRTIESEFSEALQKELIEEKVIDMTIDGPIVTKLHPKIIWARLQLKYDSQRPVEMIQIPGWFYDCFANVDEASAKYPSIGLKFEGRPWAMYQFMNSTYQDAIIDFGDLGTVVLSRQELSATSAQNLYWHQLPLWLNYALSPEVWGTQGKWTRFHARLEKLFNDYGLLKENSKPLHYVLKEDVVKLKNQGFEGTLLEKSYVLVLPWSFSLTALEQLEKSIRLEFSNVHS